MRSGDRSGIKSLGVFVLVLAVDVDRVGNARAEAGRDVDSHSAQGRKNKRQLGTGPK